MSSSSPSPLPPSTTESPVSTTSLENSGYTPGWDFATRWRNQFSYKLGYMTIEGQRQYIHDRDIHYKESDCQRCEEYRDDMLKMSPTVRFLQQNIRKLGGELGRENIYCIRCDDMDVNSQEIPRWGGFDARFGIDICANRIKNKNSMEDSLAHEMIHAWDYLRFKVNKNDLRHQACTEIRASNLSGECRLRREFWDRGQWKITKQHQECVRRRAIKSVSSRPNCESEEHAAKVVDEVWNSCTRDTRPFDEIYR